MTLGEYVVARDYGEDFLNLYIVPMSSAVWSTPPELMLSFPALTLMHFWHNHGFLGLHTQHPWWTVTNGAKSIREKAHRAVQGSHPPRFAGDSRRARQRRA
jgi:predicted NAD/FAD-binding protein